MSIDNKAFARAKQNHERLTCRFSLSVKTCGGSGTKESLVGMEPLIKFLFSFIPSIPSSEDARLFSKQLCSKCAELSDVYFPIGSLKSTRCRWTNFTHFALTVGSDGKRCMEIPGVYPVFVQLSLLGVPAAQNLPPFRVGFLLFSAMICCESSRLTAHIQIT